MSVRRYVLPAFTWLVLAGCSSAQQPAQVDTRNDACAHCRMTVSDLRFAAQIVAPGEEPRFFDDIGCLRDFLKKAEVSKGATSYVADHRTKTWVAADKAVYVRNDQVQTPMASHLLAYGDPESRDADRDGIGTRLTVTAVFGPGGPPAGAK